MTSELCEDGGDGQREKEASSVSPLERPGPWSNPLSPVTAPVQPARPRRSASMVCPLSCQEAEGSHPPLRPPPGLSCSSRAQLAVSDSMSDWFHLLLEADDLGGS